MRMPIEYGSDYGRECRQEYVNMDVWHIFSSDLRGSRVRYAAVRVPKSNRDANWADAVHILPAWWRRRWYQQEGLCHEDCVSKAHCRPHKNVIIWTNKRRDESAFVYDDAHTREIFRG